MEANELNKSSEERTNLNTGNQSGNTEQTTEQQSPEEVKNSGQEDQTPKREENKSENQPEEVSGADGQESETTKLENSEEPEKKLPQENLYPEEMDYTSLSREQLIEKFKDNLNKYPVSNIKTHAEAIRLIFENKTKEEEVAAKQKFIESGEPEESFDPQPDFLQKDFAGLFAEYRNKRDEERLSQENEKEKNLKDKYEVIEGIKDLINRQESLNDTFQEFRTLQQKWRDIGPVPQNKLHDLWETFHLHVENFYNYIKINNELRDLDLKKNYESKLALCEKAETLLLEPSPVKAFKTLQKYHDQWREIGPVPRDKKDELWDRFKAATSKINQRQHEHFESLKNQLHKNLEAKIELCEKAEALLQQEITSPREWENKSKQLIDLQQIWKTIGFAPKKDNNLVYDRFRKACDEFFNRKRDFFKNYKDEQQNNLQLKTELCIQAEAMKESNDWKKTTEEYIRIQKKWKEIGPVPRKQSDAIWKRFREACDYFFNRKSKFFNNIDAEQDENLNKKEAIIKELQDFELQDDSEKCFAVLQDFQRRWSEVGFVPIKDKDRINQDFRNLINQKFDHLNLDEVNKNLQKFRNKLENWKSNDQFNEKIGQERNKIMLKLKQLESDIVLWENNIGFFTKSKNSEALVRDFKHKIENGKRNIELLNKKLDLIDEML
ncbi:DUF349 domain-containing protein [Alkalitalea saponilacus]|uniref:DUF349 domain-containing protein n=1 Tax=Alkalitalea saponilacus TaxID=889453 RepID=A0A1T5HSA9_9BACT|nr:DUF349 domain-containing protein [Alkalitalea saponilacus]ASB50063.1 DNA primase [Alkalitalea saponilacus]SKC23421.1 protein of unknown function [Alkalitalea saponilacus]